MSTYKKWTNNRVIHVGSHFWAIFTVTLISNFIFKNERENEIKNGSKMFIVILLLYHFQAIFEPIF